MVDRSSSPGSKASPASTAATTDEERMQLSRGNGKCFPNAMIPSTRNGNGVLWKR